MILTPVKPLADHADGTWAVYFIAAPDANVVKIGQTKFLSRRFKELKVFSPVPLVFLGWVHAGMKLERALHDRLARSRSHWEWFTLTDEVKDALNDFDIWLP